MTARAPLLRLPLLLLRARCRGGGAWPVLGIAETTTSPPLVPSSPSAIFCAPARVAAGTSVWFASSAASAVAIAQQQQQQRREFASGRGGSGGGGGKRPAAAAAQQQNSNKPPPNRSREGQQQQREQRPRRNEQIRAPMLRVVIPPEVAAQHQEGGERPPPPTTAAADANDADADADTNNADNNPAAAHTRIMSRADALALARQAGLDLVEVAAHAQPPVARVCDWGREAYLRSMSREASERRQRVRARLDTPKELPFTPRIADHDLATKMRQMAKWLASGQRVAVVVRFRRNEDEAAEQAAAYLSARLVGENPGAEAGAAAKGPRSVTVIVRPPAGAAAAAAAAAAATAAVAAGGGGGQRAGGGRDSDGWSDDDEETSS